MQQGKEREIEIKKIPAESKSQPQASQKIGQAAACAEKCPEKCTEQETGKEKSEKSTNIPVSREVEDKK